MRLVEFDVQRNTHLVPAFVRRSVSGSRPYTQTMGIRGSVGFFPCSERITQVH